MAGGERVKPSHAERLRAERWMRDVVLRLSAFEEQTVIEDITLTVKDATPGFLIALREIQDKTLDRDLATLIFCKAYFPDLPLDEARARAYEICGTNEIPRVGNPKHQFDAALTPALEALKHTPRDIAVIQEQLGFEHDYKFAQFLGMQVSTYCRQKKGDTPSNLQLLLRVACVCAEAGIDLPDSLKALGGAPAQYLSANAFFVLATREPNEIKVRIPEHGLHTLAQYFGLDREFQGR